MMGRSSSVLSTTLAGGIQIRPLTSQDGSWLWDMLYLAIYLPPGVAPFPDSFLRQPPLAGYVQGWGREGDFGFAAMDGPATAGAAWARQFVKSSPGYGFVDEAIPELSVAVEHAYRSRGIGSLLLTSLLEAASKRVPGVSLSVTETNPAVRLYVRLGFEIVGRSKESLIMLKRLTDPSG